jgi:hypothetical protein
MSKVLFVNTVHLGKVLHVGQEDLVLQLAYRASSVANASGAVSCVELEKKAHNRQDSPQP